MAEKQDENTWHDILLRRLHERDQRESVPFTCLIRSFNKLMQNADALKGQNVQMTLQLERYRTDNLDLQVNNEKSTSVRGEKTLALEQKLFRLQEELTDLHRRKGENSQQIIDLNNLLQEKDKQLSHKEALCLDSKYTLEALQKESKNLQATILELESTNQLLKDEQQALQLAYNALEHKFRKLQEENRELVDRWMMQKALEADKMNEDNEIKFQKKQEQIQKDIAEAAKEPFTFLQSSHDSFPMFCAMISLPSTAQVKMEAHDGEINSIACSSTGRVFATGSSDRKVKLWETANGKCELRGTLTGSNAAVMAVDFDSEETLLLGSSNDFASRVWTVEDQRLRHTLTGHSNKVLAAKFLGGPHKVVTGSYDRTLKIWDLRSKACVRTIFAGSSCNDLVTADGSATIISGHFDKRIRFWDTRNETSSNEILLQGRVTSLHLAPDGNSLLSCSRDDTLKLIDLRMKQVTGTFCEDGFHVSCDWTAARFSPDGQYISVGSSDGSIFVWNITTKKLELTLREHHHAVICCAWSPDGTELYTCDKQKKLIVWADKW